MRTLSAGSQTNEFELVAASVTGFDHQSHGEPCQDAVSGVVGDGWAVAVVSDGAGSARRGADGAQVLVQEVCGFLSEKLRVQSQLCGWVDQAVIEAVERARWRCTEAREDGDTLRNFHATLVGGILTAYGGLIFQIGDGGAAAYHKTDASIEIDAFSPAENGEYINETFFFTEDNWRTHLRFCEVPVVSSNIWLMTDGAYHLVVPPRTHSLRELTVHEIERLVFQAPYEERNAVLERILASTQASSRNDDDKSIAIIRRMPQ